MNKVIRLIVEGDGEVTAAPLLVRRLLEEHHQRSDFTIERPINAHGTGNIETQMERFLELTRRSPDCKGVIVLRDTEREHCDCPPDLALGLAERARKLNLPFPVVVVCATCEYESWFLASLHTIMPGATFEGDPEKVCGAKAWLTHQMPPGHTYKETSDQAKMTAVLDIPHTISRSRSFRRMVEALSELIEAVDSQQGERGIVTPP